MIPKEKRLKRQDVEYILKKGSSITTTLLVARFMKAEEARFAVITSSRLAKKAVERNRIKRRINEAIRLKMPKDLRVSAILIPKKRIINVEYQRIEKDIEKLFKTLLNGQKGNT